jgi:YHYH protein
MKETRIKISSIIENQLPQYVLEEFPLASEFLSQYYISLENQGGTSDILQNIDQYIKVDNLTNLIDSTFLTSDVTFFDSTVNVNSTAGFPDSYGLILIDSEIITYTSKTSTSFNGCVRGFNGVTSHIEKYDELTFKETNSEEHSTNSIVSNLSILFLKEFLIKIKKQFTPGFENRELYSGLNENIFIKQSIDFYSSKGTDKSFKILFGALFGQNVDVIKPRDYLIQPSDADYRITSDFVVESIEGDPENLENKTLYQDKNEFINAAQGTISKVEKIIRGAKEYYILSLDSGYDKDIQTRGSVYGQFTIHPITRLVSPIKSGSTTLEVDSTVAFPTKNGNLVIELENGTSLNVTYESKTLNQFLGCNGIVQDISEATEIKSNLFAYGYGSNETIKIRILGVLSELEYPTDTRLYSKGDSIKVKTLGTDLKDYRSNNWFFNIPTKYDVSSIKLLDISDRSYRVDTTIKHSFKIGDSVTLISSSSVEYTGNVTSFNNENSFSVQFGSEISPLNVNSTYIVRRNLAKVITENYPSVNQYTSNVQNVYVDDEDSLYISSPSLPTYLNTQLKINDRSITFSGTFSGEIIDTTFSHGFYTGDSIVYKPSTNNTLGISTGIYFVKKIDETKLKLARSRSNIFTENFISVNGTVTNATFELTEFTYRDLSTQLLESQKLIRKISIPENNSTVYETTPGLTGIFINGVEVLNYKSNDNVFYGPIESIAVTSPGSGYDIINPPILSVIDPMGSGAEGYCSVIGGLERIDIIDPGFDYLEDPTITIIGGNGSGASAKASLISFDHEVSFNSQANAGSVKLDPINTIGFSIYHKFRDIEEVIYITDAQKAISGLSTNSSYFVSVQDAFTIKLHKSFSDAVSGINTIGLTSYGTGNHSFKSKNKKKKIGSIAIENVGEGYQNKLTTTSSSGINTSTDIININNHGYQSGEIVTYNSTETPVSGLSSSTSYYVTKVDDNNFKLSQIGVGTLGITTSLYYDTKQYVNLVSGGTGIHKFNYPDIQVSVNGRIGVSTFSGKDFSADIQPVFRGEIQSVFVKSGGIKYGSEEILNYNRQPLFELNSGSGIQVKPIVSNGQIVDVIINSSGSGYNSPPNLNIIGIGTGAILTPILSNGSLSEVKVIYGGIGYEQKNTFINVIASGSSAKFESQIKSWKINLVERSLYNSQIRSDDGILTAGLNNDYGLEYAHAYAPRPLRSSVQSTSFRQGKSIYSIDLQLLDGREQTSVAHSPIIGWAYDGNPIYGPYGYSSKTGGAVKSLNSGYELSLKENRPSVSLYPQGFFIEDYSFTNSGDLDEHNGRFSITPEYPNGIYAYFTTISSGPLETTGLFENYKKPIFPYVIGNSYKSTPIDFNFSKSSSQDYIDINQTKWKRNITPYNISTYNYLLKPNEIRSQNSIIKSVSKGSVDAINILSAGQDYSVGDSVIFDVNSKEVFKPRAQVSSIEGKSIDSISCETLTFNDVVIYPNKDKFVGFTTIPHDFLNNDLLTFTGKYDYKKSGKIIVSNNTLTLTSGVGSAQYTGITTYFDVFGNLNYPNIKENDIYEIGNEQVKILSIDEQSSRIKVLRNQNNTIGLTSYSSGIGLTEKSRKFGINFGISTSYNFDVDREFYFDPKETIGLGTISGVGIVSTLYFSNPGAGITQITIPTRSIYIKNHNLVTGDSLTYSSNGGSRISVSTNGSSSFQLAEKSIVYVAKISNDLIGISTIKVGIGSTGNFVSVGSTLQANLLYFTSVGTGNTHSFKTNIDSNLTGQISKNVVTVSTAETHGLSLLDTVTIDAKPGISTTLILKYDDYNRRLLVNQRYFSNIDTDNSIITINNHGYYTGQKVLYTSNTPAVGLVNEKMYYVVSIDANKIKLSNTYYDSVKEIPNTINILSSTSGNICPINPPIKIVRNQSVIFDLSDVSLSFVSVGNTYSAFDFKLYVDELLKDEFDTTSSSSIFEVSKSGKIGIDSTAKVTLTINENVPDVLYYNLVPINLNLNLQSKKEIITDNDVLGSNKISIVESGYNGKYTIIGITSTSFKYNILNYPESNSYLDGVKYYTNSKFASGPIHKISILSGGKNYTSLPGITSVSSKRGSGSILTPDTNSIGKIISIDLQDIGFEYPSDYSVRPTSKLPTILVLDSLSTFDYIGVSSFGRNYSISPSLVVIDGSTNKIIDDVELSYSIGDTKVKIITNSSQISNVTPIIIPTNNTNGIGITNIQFNNATKDVTVTLGASFSDPEDFPFFVGGKVLIEGINVGISTTGRGYNSSNYNYSLFTITSIDPNIGGIGATVTYNLSPYLEDGQIPGNFNKFNSSGRIILESDFPIFNPVLKKKDYYKGESVYSSSAEGIVEYWDSKNQYLKVSALEDFELSQTIKGKTSSTVAVIREIISFKSNYTVDSSSLTRKGWNRETGFLNNDFQRVHDSDYYQYFSYALKSQKDLDTWEDSVNSLNHTAGFKKFSDLVIESTPTNSGISTDQNQGDFVGVADLSRTIDLNCVYDFDLAKENNLNIDGFIKSNEITLNSKIVQDYIESIGNRVLVIDDISTQFNNNSRSTKFSIVDSLILNDFRSKKYILLVQDKKYSYEQQLNIISLIHNDSIGFINQYGLNSIDNLGFFDFNISGTSGNLLFYPVKSKYNDYYTEIFSFSLNDVTSGIGTINLGNTVNINTSTQTIPTGTTGSTTIVGIASTYRSSKVLVQIGATDSSYYQYDEITYIHDNNNVYFIDFGQLTTDNFISKSTSGIGTYNAYISGSEVKIDLIPNNSTTVDYTVNTFNVSIGNSSSSGIGTIIVGGSSINSSLISIPSSPSPTANIVSSYSNSEYNCSYCIFSIEDKTNSQYQISEFLTITSQNESCISEFGVLQTNSSLGIITSGISGTNTIIYFTPIKNANVEVRVFKVDIGLSENFSEISLNNGAIDYNYGDYKGTDNDVAKSFNLTHKNVPIFKRYFDGSNPSVVRIADNIIRIPNNFYVTGEEITYSSPGDGTSKSIGIATTSIPGIGVTDKLPSTLYVVKLNDLDIKVAASSSDALKSIPNVLDLTSVGGIGIGNSHVFISKNQNKKVILGIDNLIQSPIVSTSSTSILLNSVAFFDPQIYVSDTKSITGGDLIQIDNEIMKVTAVGVASTNSISVLRPWLGTSISTHTSSSLVTKVIGNYNIIDNTLYFSEPPYGKTPIQNPSNRPDEIDYVGISTGSSFSGRVFLRTADFDTVQEPYTNNIIFDDISNKFNGIDTDFILKSNGSNVTGISTDNAVLLVNNIFQGPYHQFATSNYDLVETSGITSVSFIGSATSVSYDVNSASIPRGGIILSIASTQGFGYQPLVSAGGTAVVSSAGTIQSISIGNSGSGYRSGIQTIVRVGVQTESVGIPNIEFVGIASIKNGHVVSVAITNPGAAYTSTNPPIVVFDSPLSYSNIPLVYSSKSSSGIGTGAKVDIVVGQGSSVISFELKNLGYGYKQNEILTVSIGGTTGIATNTSLTFKEFQISIDSTYSDQFSAWTIGNLQVIDSIESLFDGQRTSFPILIEGNQTTIRSKKGSNIDVQATLLIFINDILQVPGKGYIFNGGSTIRFTEPPKEEDRCKILFYRGTSDVDTQDVDILETIKSGDFVTLKSDDNKLEENERLVYDIISSDIVSTNLYFGPGISRDDNLLRPLTWCRQTNDLVINGKQIGKNRIIYEPYIQPTTNIIQNIGITTNVIFVESVKSFFDSEKEYTHDGTTEKPQNKILIVSQDSLVAASGTVTVSTSGTITSVNISSGGVGYSTAPSVSISYPIGIGSTGVAEAQAVVTSGSVSSVAITTGGFGYSSTEPPIVLFESPSTKYEVIDKVSYEGDFGIISGIKTTSVGVASTGIVFDLFIPKDSVLRDSNIVSVGVATTGISGIKTGYYFVVSESNVGKGLTSLNSLGGIVGVGSTFIDNIYQVAAVSIAQTAVAGVGITNVTKVTVSVSGYNGLSGLGFSNFYGKYSWGRISVPTRKDPQEFTSYANVGGITSSPAVQRFTRLKYIGYSTT